MRRKLSVTAKLYETEILLEITRKLILIQNILYSIQNREQLPTLYPADEIKRSLNRILRKME